MVKQERAQRTRRSLIHAAAEVFAQEGYTPASLTTISRRAGVSNGALHFHFANKQSLAQAVEDEALASLALITRAAEGCGLQALVEATYELMSRLADDVVVRAGFGLGADRARGGSSAPRRDWGRWVGEMLRRAEQEGRLAEGVSWRVATHAVVAATAGLEVLGGEDPEWLTRRTIDDIWELLLPRLSAEVCQ